MSDHYLTGIDVGSTTTKVAVLDPDSHETLFFDYRRHNADQLASVKKALLLVLKQMEDKALSKKKIRLCFTGSGARFIADCIDIPFVQEVVANSIALREVYDDVGTAIELGGQDAKMIFFSRDSQGNINVADMRMNGSCAGGTGAFIDEVASILKAPAEELDEMASKGDCVYDISGRCGVYAKTDIQPLLNQGISKENLALSSFHAIAKQTIGGLAQGLDIEKPVVFEGGPLTFNPTLIKVFKERLELTEEETLIPEHPEMMIARGAALSLLELFAGRNEEYEVESILERVEKADISSHAESLRESQKFFETKEEFEEFKERHKIEEFNWKKPEKGETIKAFLGIDSGSTTTKFVLMGEDEELLDCFYAFNEADPMMVAKNALIELRDKYKEAGAKLEILACGTTGYGELLFNKAFDAETHVVETVAHARAAAKYVEDVSFILDIGGQDMKAIWLDEGIITNIVVNEACSSGCGSFLANFADNLGIKVPDIAKAAFSSQDPAVLGSRCTVFMNSSVITEQRNGKKSEDIMAGLCRSIIENVFTKVIRVSNLDSLGDKIVVQGGTFRNDAVLRAMEQYIGRQVKRAPYPGLMGAIGVALITAQRYRENPANHSFIGLDAMDSFGYTQEANIICPFCTNHCKRTVVNFTNNKSWITGNRCERGEVLGDPKDEKVQKQIRYKNEVKAQVPDLFKLRNKLLFDDYDYEPLLEKRGVTIGIPRVLSFWETMPFWTTFWKSLGYDVKLSDMSNRAMYEDGLHAVTSDTVCFPAKLVHGHLRNLVKKGVDRIFMPSITTVESENTEATSESMCAVVKGYPIVVRNSDNPEKRYGIPFDAPLFHWHTNEDRRLQLTTYMKNEFCVPPALTQKAIEYGDEAQREFKKQLKKAGEAVIKDVELKGDYAVVLASRPYQCDMLVNHELPQMFTSMGIPVLTADSVPGSEEVNLSNTKLDVVNNFHARMLSTAIMSAMSENLEYTQVVSFGCGHDAYLSDEIIRMMKEISGKVPLVLKLDESDVTGPLRIRVRSFVETIQMRRAWREELKKEGKLPPYKPLKDPYPVKFENKDMERTVLVPNASHAFSRLLAVAFAAQGLRTVSLPYGRQEAIRLGKQYVHNDICFPAQIVIGEALEALRSGKYDPDKTAVAMGKYIGDCRLTHYAALLRKALDDAGYPQVPIITNDDVDYHDLHPAYKMNLMSAIKVAFGLPMIDILEELLRKIRPYELEPGESDRVFEESVDLVVEGLRNGGIGGMKAGFSKAIDLMKDIKYDRSNPRPKVLIVGEYLLNFHPGANHDIELYLEKNGFEIVEARMTDVIRKTYFYQDSQVKEYHIKKPLAQKAMLRIENNSFHFAHDMADKIAKKHPLYERAARMNEIVGDSDEVIHHTFDAGEGVLIPGEIIHHAKHGCKHFVILQPFGCLPNHVVGRGICKKLKEMFPDVQILPLDYDPDVSFANIENRLQMLINNAKIEA
ncbi:MAG: 2-hydroxyacyl-CoA dehydratase [Lachnospiraceae bacterium]|nr:2-hydroxyacyl-CoA dehydratase [Lachnospiraceae bacterium]